MPSSLPHQRSSAIQPDVNPSGRTPLAVDSLRLENPLQIWLSDCLKDAFTLMEQRAHSFHEGVRGVANFQDEADRAKRYLLIDTLLQSPCSLSGNPGRKILQDIIAGFLHEFSRQTVLGVPPLNIANPNKPQPVAKAFWESRPVELFERQRFTPLVPTINSYRNTSICITTAAQRPVAKQRGMQQRSSYERRSTPFEREGRRYFRISSYEPLCTTIIST